jgi:hypothetical protein
MPFLGITSKRLREDFAWAALATTTLTLREGEELQVQHFWTFVWVRKIRKWGEDRRMLGDEKQATAILN